jgi:photosystem II stability/assembly factor-like uncharacterized protein
MKKVKYLKSLIILFLPFILGMFDGKCEYNILEIIFYIPCDVPPTVNFTASAPYHSYNQRPTVFITAGGAIYMSFDRCLNPALVTTVPGNPRLNDIKVGFWNSFNVIAGNNGTIVRSSANDTVWRVRNTPTTQNLNKLCISSVSEFFDYSIAIGNSGTIIASRDAGLTWYPKNFPLNKNLRDIECDDYFDTLHIRVIGDDMTAYFTTNGGATWIDDSLYNELDKPAFEIETSSGGPGLNAMQFVNSNSGYIAGEFGVFFKTFNGGNLYFSSVVPDMTNIIDMHFISADTGFVVNIDGKVRFTTDRGTSWFEDTSVTSLIAGRTVNSVNPFTNDYGYISGSNGLLALIARDSNIIGIKPAYNTIPNGYKLFQNYPNPFNPSTKIRFDVASVHRTDIKLVIYDLLGREIEILVDELLQPGVYEVEWNPSGYPSGVYFYQLIVNSEQPEGFKETKKMVLIK